MGIQEPIKRVITDTSFRWQDVLNGQEWRVDHPAHVVPKEVDELLQKALSTGNPSAAELQFDGVKVQTRQHGGYPNVTFSHYALGRALKEEGINARRVVDLGCGVGFSGNYAAKHLGAEEIVFADLNHHAIQQAVGAYFTNSGSQPASNLVTPSGQRVKFNNGQTLDLRLGDVQQTLIGQYEADIALAAPMFVPGVCEVFPQAYLIFAHTAKRIGATLYIGHSNLATPVIDGAVRQIGSTRETIFEQEVPFRVEYTDMRVPSARMDDGSLNPAVESGLMGLGLKKSGSSYSHKLTVSIIK